MAMLGNGDVRLADGGSPCAGRVEMEFEGQWGTVCHKNSHIRDVQVLCRQIGCGDGMEIMNETDFGYGKGHVWPLTRSCKGTEAHLLECPLPQGTDNCGHPAVSCSGVRLVGGTSRCSGRVEVHREKTWGTVCDADFDQQDAEFVCRELGCGVPVEVRGAAAFGKGEGQVWSAEIQCRGNESQIHLCPKSLTQKQNCSHENDVGLVCSGSADIRLMDGGSPCAGRVEVRHEGLWGTVCSDGWDMTDAEVVCRQLGCGAAVEAPSGAHFFPGSGRIWLSDVSCNGSESTLKNCDSGGWGNHNCDHKKDVGVICSAHQRVRLVGGTHLCSGRVEVHHGNSWGTVCDADFDQQDAEVMCRELGCGVPVEVRGAAAFGKGEGQVWSEEIQCRGNESQIYFCPTSPTQKQNCSHENDVGLVCSGNDDVRLVDGGSPCAGRVEVRHEGQWGTVCHVDWDETDAEVVCKQLGCGAAAAALYNAQSPTSGKIQGKGRIWMSDVFCSGTESTLKKSHRKVRLVEGTHLCSGRVEVHRGNTWGTVCDAAFDQQDAEVVCRELGCGVPVEVRGAAAFGKGEGQVWPEEIQCRGNESQIYFCPTSPTQKQNCPHENDVGLVCSGYTESRLVNGPDRCSGRVELKYLSIWGTVCDACWDMKASNVLCQQLSCGRAVAVLGQAWFGEGNDSVWADVFECQGNETRSSLSALDGMVQLSGERECEGQVEVFYQQTWRRVLLGSWSFRDASVVCRQLGCGSAVNYSSSPSGRGESDVCLTGFQCSGKESHLGNCSAPHNLTCGSKEQVSIICSSEYRRSLRLVGGGGDCAGRLEVFHRGSWGTVCDDSWDLQDAQVVCRQLQCGTALSVVETSKFRPGTGPIWLDEVDCLGNETSLWECPKAEWGQTDCGHKQDVVVMCSEFKQLRLGTRTDTRVCSGLAEVFYNGTWGSVCVNDMTETTAAVICRQLGCGDRGTFDTATVSHGVQWIDNIKCRRHDESLWQCPSSPWGHKCSFTEAALISCEGPRKDISPNDSSPQQETTHVQQCPEPPELRLVGPSKCSGRVEVRIEGSWGTVCDDSWDMREAQVVCRQLGCGEAVRAEDNATFGRGNGTIWLDEVNCTGDELHLWDCCRSPLNQSDCSHKEDAGVTCADETAPTPAPQRLSIPAVALLVLGALFFLLLVVLVVLLFQNRALKKALSVRDHAPLRDAVYEEIEYKPVKGGAYSTPPMGSVLSEDLPSGYEDVGDSEGHSLSGESGRGEKGEDYDDVITEESAGVLVTDNTLENYDDVITVDPSTGSAAEIWKSGDYTELSYY
ncbi:antigen WC1.1-like [Megalops cyprinoides]|uniref:antigen WC1.1-like n=1 Tax=Megalops cyprinoides TaxID=118141 RepID=UPI00186550DE|nr:antigen WC1.1-like [Megalops cyprinoides]